MIDAIIFIIGTIIGSFLNGCITRIPKKKSIISQPSSCPGCGQKIRKTHIIPIISYFWFGGECLYCQWKLPGRYFLVEFITGVILTLVHQVYRFNPLFFQHAIFSLLLIIITFIDIENKLIFNKITIPGILIGVGSNLLINNSEVMSSVYGIFAGSGFLIIITLLGNIIFKKESLGGGDIKFAAMIGSFIGLNGILFSMIIAVFSAMIVGIILLLINKTEYLPFGPFLSFGAIVYVLTSSKLIMFLN